MTVGKGRIVSIRVGSVLLGIGVVCGIVAALLLLGAVGSAVNDVLFRDPCRTPCSVVRELDAGNYVIFEKIGHTTQIGPLSSSTEDPATISRADVTVTSPGRRTLDVLDVGSSQTIDRNGTTYGGVVGFHVEERGRYRVSVDSPDETLILLAPSLGQTFVKALPGGALAAVGFVVAVSGLGVLIVAWTRRRRTAEQ